MRRFAGLLGTVLLLSCNNATYGGGGGGGGCTPTATKVCMVGKSFSPTNLTISTGTAVSWDNGSTLTHTVTSSRSEERRVGKEWRSRSRAKPVTKKYKT